MTPDADQPWDDRPSGASLWIVKPVDVDGGAVIQRKRRRPLPPISCLQRGQRRAHSAWIGRIDDDPRAIWSAARLLLVSRRRQLDPDQYLTGDDHPLGRSRRERLAHDPEISGLADNATGAQELWLRGGFEWRPLNNVTIKDQVYSYQAKRNWLDSETYAFSLTTPGGTLPCPGSQPTCIDRDRFAVFHNQNIFGNNADLTWDSLLFGMENRFAAQLQTSSNRITFKEDISEPFPDDTVSVINPQPGLYGPLSLSTRNSTLDDIAGSFEDRLKLTPAFALIGGVRVERLALSRDGVNADGRIPSGLPFSVSWEPVSYRAAYTYEPIRDSMFYGMYATAYNPAVAAVFSITPGTSLQLTSSRIYETGAKQLFWDGRAEWTAALYDIVQRNVFIPISTTETVVAGEVTSKGIELAAAVRPVEGLKLWGNAAFIHARFGNFSSFTGNVPPNVATLIVNVGGAYRFDHWRWPLEVGGSMRYVGNRFLEQNNLTTLNAYTTADAYAFVDIPGRDVAMPELENLRISVRVRNLTNAVYATWSDTTYPDQILLGAPRTYEIGASARW